jgi:hypothetical protein
MLLPVIAPPPCTALLRFVTTKDSPLSEAIRFDEAGSVSHVEAVMQSGNIIASLIGEGVQEHPGDYDKTSTMQIFVGIPMLPPQYGKWQDFLVSKIGSPYDNLAIAAFATRFNLHERGALICSALQVDALRHCGFFPVPLAQKYHQISPVVLLLMLQAQSRGRVFIHPPEIAK